MSHELRAKLVAALENARLRKTVLEALDNAFANGYAFYDHDDGDVADDLASYEAQLERVDPSKLVEHVRTWRDSRPEMLVVTDGVHIAAGSIARLHGFAEAIGLRRRWFHGLRKGHPHYDRPSKLSVDSLVRSGARVVRPRELLAVSKRSAR